MSHELRKRDENHVSYNTMRALALSLTTVISTKSDSKVCNHTLPHTHVKDISLFYWTSQVTL